RRSMARSASSLRRYFAWLTRTGVVASDPARGLSAPKGESRLPRVLRPDELTSLLDDPPAAVDLDPEPLRWRDDAVLALLSGGGLRGGGVRGLGGADVRPRSGSVTGWGRGGRQRRVRISQPCAEAVAAWTRRGRAAFVAALPATSAAVDDEALFLNRRGRRLS